VKASYFQLAYIQKTLGVLERDQTLLDQIEKIAEARYRVGQGNQQDVLKAQLQKTKILNELAHHHELMGSQQALMSKILNRAPGAAEIETEDLTETPLNFKSDELLAKIRADNPEVTGRQEMVRKQSLQVEIARKDRYPDFSVQYMWQHTAEQYRDYYMLTFSARLPIYRKRRQCRKPFESRSVVLRFSCSYFMRLRRRSDPRNSSVRQRRLSATSESDPCE
jgi:outer membrane protein TolC